MYEFIDLEKFSWWRSKEGYCWDDDATLNASSSDGPYLIAKPTTTEYVEYHPLEETSSLFIKFAELKTDRESVLKFVNKYGRLQSLGDGPVISKHYSLPKNEEVPENIAWDHRARGQGMSVENYQSNGLGTLDKNGYTYYKVLGESYSTWLKEINTMKEVKHFWEWIKYSETTGKAGNLASAILWRQDRSAVGYVLGDIEEIKSFRSNGTPKLKIKWIADEEFSQKTELEAFSHFKYGDSLLPAKYALHQIINKKMASLTFQLKLQWTAESMYKQYTVPNDLLACVWYQFFLNVTGEKRHRRCEICNEWMDISDSSKNKIKHDKCSANLRSHRRYHYSKVHRGELEITDIVQHFFGKSIEWIKDDYSTWLNKQIKKNNSIIKE